MFRKIGRIQTAGLRWFFSTQQHQQNQGSFQFSQNFTASSHNQPGENGSSFQHNTQELFAPVEYPPYAGNSDDSEEKDNEEKQLDSKENANHYDVIVIGGGSGGLSFSLEASRLGLKVIVFDFVDPSHSGTRWGLGGTCVNVGCIPKKLFHTASLIKDNLAKQSEFGFGQGNTSQFAFEQPSSASEKTPKLNFKWRQLVSNIQNYISDLNLGFEAQLINRNIPYKNALATLFDDHTVYFSKDKSELIKAVKEQDFSQISKNKVTGDYIVIAVGGRPTFLSECVNSHQHSISSDDIFSLKRPPGKTLVVGGGYVALESAGFLSNLGYDTTVMTRGKYLKDFDQDVVQMIVDDMKQFNKVKFIDQSLPISIHKENTANNLFKVCYKHADPAKQDSEEKCDTFNTILQAVGRTPNTSLLNLQTLGIKTDPQTKKIIGGFEGDSEKTSRGNIFCLGDVLKGVPELTPPAQMAGRLLANRIHNLKNNQPIQERHKMNYSHIATTVFTPLEYGSIGMTEEQAISTFGEESIEVYHSKFIPLEEQLSFQYDSDGNILKRKGYVKLICNKKDNLHILGMHYFGPNAGEILQGYSVAFKMKLFKHQLDDTVGIHPTCAEEFLNLKVTKQSGENFDKETC